MAAEFLMEFWSTMGLKCSGILNTKDHIRKTPYKHYGRRKKNRSVEQGDAASGM